MIAIFRKPGCNPSNVFEGTSPILAILQGFSPQMTLKVKVKCPHFQYCPRYKQDTHLGANLVILAKKLFQLLHRQDKFNEN